MKFARLVWVNLFRNKRRTFLTAISVAVAFFLFGTLRTVITTLDAAAEVGSEARLVAKSASGITFPLPQAHAQRLEAFGDRVRLMHDKMDQVTLSDDSFDLVICVGSAHAFGPLPDGFDRALKECARIVVSGGVVLFGHTCWSKVAPASYLTATGIDANDFGTHRHNVSRGESVGLIPIYRRPRLTIGRSILCGPTIRRSLRRVTSITTIRCARASCIPISTKRSSPTT